MPELRAEALSALAAELTSIPGAALPAAPSVGQPKLLQYSAAALWLASKEICSKKMVWSPGYLYLARGPRCCTVTATQPSPHKRHASGKQ